MLDKKTMQVHPAEKKPEYLMHNTNEAVGISRFFFWLAHVFLIAAFGWLFFSIYMYAHSDKNWYMYLGIINTVIILVVYLLFDRLAKISVDHRFRDMNSPHETGDFADDDE
jgi:hypothetical protein